MVRLLKEQDVNIEVKHEGILEVPEGKNVDDLPMSHFEKLAKKKGLGKITKALNNLQVWNKKKDPKLSKWAGDMIDKLNKKLKKDESVKSRKSIKESGMYDYYDVPDGAFDLGSDMPDLDDLWAANKGLPVEDFIQDALDHGFSKMEIHRFLKTSGIRNEKLKKESHEIPIGWKERTIAVDDDEQEDAVEEILTYAKRDNDKIEWDVDYNGGMFGGDRVFYIYSDGDTFSEVQYTVKQMKDDAIYGRGVYEST